MTRTVRPLCISVTPLAGRNRILQEGAAHAERSPYLHLLIGRLQQDMIRIEARSVSLLAELGFDWEVVGKTMLKRLITTPKSKSCRARISELTGTERLVKPNPR